MKSKEIGGIIKFKNYVVDAVEFRNNPDFEGKEATIQFEPSVDFDIDGNDMLVVLTVDIFKDAIKHNYPFFLEFLFHYKITYLNLLLK